VSVALITPMKIDRKLAHKLFLVWQQFARFYFLSLGRMLTVSGC